jgi:RND family efflux transporter MFP subunit
MVVRDTGGAPPEGEALDISRDFRRRILAAHLRPCRLGLCALALAAALARAAGADDAAATTPSGVDGLECLVEPQQRVVVSAPVEGVLASITVDRGDLVEAGQVIATLESSLEKAAVASARARAESVAALHSSEARWRFEKRRLERGLQLAKKGVVPETEIDEIESAVAVAEANLAAARDDQKLAQLELARAEAALARRIVQSPLRGVVVRRIANPSEYVDPPAVAELAQIDPLRVEVFAPVALFGSIRVGTRGTVMLEAPLGGEHAAEVTVVDRVVDAASGTFGVRLALPNPDHALPAGLKCRVRFESARAGAAERVDALDAARP